MLEEAPQVDQWTFSVSTPDNIGPDGNTKPKGKSKGKGRMPPPSRSTKIVPPAAEWPGEFTFYHVYHGLRICIQAEKASSLLGENAMTAEEIFRNQFPAVREPFNLAKYCTFREVIRHIQLKEAEGLGPILEEGSFNMLISKYHVYHYHKFSAFMQDYIAYLEAEANREALAAQQKQAEASRIEEGRADHEKEVEGVAAEEVAGSSSQGESAVPEAGSSADTGSASKRRSGRVKAREAKASGSS